MKRSIPAACAIACAVLALLAPVDVFAQSGDAFGAPKKKAPRQPRAKTRKAAALASVWPSFEARHADWVRRKELSLASGAPAPDPLTQYLLGEITVTGLFQTDTGYGVFLLVGPTGNTFFAKPGTALFNARLAEINPASSNFVEDAEIVFLERAGKAGAERRVVRRIESATPKSAEPAVSPGPNS
jgi:hypothetical protein